MPSLLPRVNRRPQQFACLFIFIVAMVHLIIAPGVGLGVDEAHYALYALHPALSYFDHPPMVGWLQMLVAPLGYDEFTLRLVPVLLFSLINLQLMGVTGQLYPSGSRWQGLIAVLLFNSSPILQLMGWGLVPDLPLIFISLLCLSRVLAISRQNLMRDWLLLGGLFGLAGLSKYTAVFLPLGLVLYMFKTQGRCWLFQAAPWCSVVIALVIISPVLIWNYQHQWVSFEYQINHTRGDDWQWSSLLAMQAFQLLCYSFLVFIGGVIATSYGIKRGSDSDWLILFFAWPLLLVTSWSAGHGEILPNWPALGWVLLMPLIANWLCLQGHTLWVRLLSIGSTLLFAPLILFLFLFLAFKPLATFPFMRPLIQDLEGWEQAAIKASELIKPLHKESVLLVDNWSRASRIAWYAYPLPVQLTSAYQASQFDLWFGSPGSAKEGILVLDNEEVPESDVLYLRGFYCRHLESMSHSLDGMIVNEYQFYHCFKGKR